MDKSIATLLMIDNEMNNTRVMLVLRDISRGLEIDPPQPQQVQ